MNNGAINAAHNAQAYTSHVFVQILRSRDKSIRMKNWRRNIVLQTIIQFLQ